MKDKIIEILKHFEQRDYKLGGVSIAPEMYDSIANKICNDLLPLTHYNEPNECCHLGCNDCPYEESTIMELTSLHEPNQTTMNTEQDYTEQPFNLETALKHPEWVRTRDGREIDFIKEYPKKQTKFNISYVTKCGRVDTVNLNGMSSISGHEHDNDLILRVP